MIQNEIFNDGCAGCRKEFQVVHSFIKLIIRNCLEALYGITSK